MAQTQLHCSNPNYLHTFLRGQLSSQEEYELQIHLNDCPRCRQRLDNAAADAAAWNEAKQFLGNGALHDSTGDSDNGHEDATQGSQRIRQVLDALGPTDDPESLGRIGGYEVTGVVGAGGMGVVLKAHDCSLDRIVAIKIISPHLATSGSARKRFAREAKAAAAVLHPNVIAIHTVASEDAHPFLVMQYVRGTSLQKRIDSQGPLPLKDTLRIGAQIAAGLAAAHDQGLVHRDIKPANILLEEGVERVTITDFGLARAVDDASLTCSGVIAGTPQYMSPEQTRGEPIDARSDLFSLGSVLYAMCTGRSPFRAETTYGVLHRIASDNPTSVCEINSDVPEWLGQFIERLMAKRPEDRFESATQVAELLEGCLAHVQQPAASPLPGAVAKLAPIRTRRPPISKFIAAAAGAVALFFAGILIVLELDKGTLTIESEIDDVPIRIMQGDEVVKSLTVSRDGRTTRIAAGHYTVEIEHSFDKATVENGMVTLSQGGNKVVKVTEIDQTRMTVVSYSMRALLDRDSDLSVAVQLKTLIDLIRATVAPDSWNVDEVSIIAHPENRCIVVRQTDTNHRAISQLIEKLNELVESRMPEHIRHLMEHIANPAMDDLQDSMNARPEAKRDWETIKSKALTISILGNLLMQHGRQDQTEWITFSEALRDHGKSLFEVAQSQDVAIANLRLTAIRETCTNCHRVFRNPPNTSATPTQRPGKRPDRDSQAHRSSEDYQ
ncbi:protein kinase domain-containing protein [Pirellulaceae bacterium SH449]